MKFAVLVAILTVSTAANPIKRSDPVGIDVSSHQGSAINWSEVKANGVIFAYIKATEGTSYVNPDFGSQYAGATKADLIRGSYHFAQPASSSGSTQASYFIEHGGGWSADGITLPGALDLEAGCYGLSASSMISWIRSFSTEYYSSEKRCAMLYITTNWWKSCTGNSAAFASSSPLWLASWGSGMGALPAGWTTATFWQNSDHSSSNPGDQDKFIGGITGLDK
ncbi:glycoside hydrolase family 25 protein [Leucogyrophana mollusca]|uniref:Glycoside hydrolase family 25 protein n=1 Tax=Leucogyrophana mollusca TaxID=85980 RepID=A0ACB8B2K6_9AGAM|nr:glycoside hydrolase family 25 protein [Leucogyrophana mollusca]